MKKIVIFAVVAVLAMSAAMFCSCSNGETLNLYVPDGAPSLAVANIIDGQKIATHSVETTVTTGDNVIAKCQNGEADLAILPTNAAVKVCSVRNEYCFFSVNVLGLLYLVGTKQISELSQLRGETVYSIGAGNTPQYVFETILNKNGVDYTTAAGINVQYVADASTVIPLVLKGNVQFAILGEPAVTNLINKAAEQQKNVYRLWDLQQQWQQVTDSQSSGYPQAGLIVKHSLVQNKAFADALWRCLTQNADFLRDNCAQLNALMRQAGSSLNVDYTADLLERCNLTALSTKSVKAEIETYLATFSAMNSLLPLDDSIFYE